MPPEGHGIGNYSSPDPPPPYPGLNQATIASRALPSQPSSGPSHKYGEGRGHYNRKIQKNIQIAPKSAIISKSQSGLNPRHKR